MSASNVHVRTYQVLTVLATTTEPLTARQVAERVVQAGGCMSHNRATAILQGLGDALYVVKSADAPAVYVLSPSSRGLLASSASNPFMNEIRGLFTWPHDTPPERIHYDVVVAAVRETLRMFDETKDQRVQVWKMAEAIRVACGEPAITLPVLVTWQHVHEHLGQAAWAVGRAREKDFADGRATKHTNDYELLRNNLAASQKLLGDIQTALGNCPNAEMPGRVWSLATERETYKQQVVQLLTTVQGLVRVLERTVGR